MLKKLKGNIKSFLKSETVKGQGIAALIKLPTSFFLTDLGAKILFTGVGAIGGILNEGMTKKSKRKALLRHTMANMMFTIADPTANQMRAMRTQMRDLWSGLRFGNFSTAFGSLIEEPQEVVSAIKGMIPKFSFKGLSLAGLKGKFGSAGFKPSKTFRNPQSALKEIQSSVYAGADADMIEF